MKHPVVSIALQCKMCRSSMSIDLILNNYWTVNNCSVQLNTFGVYVKSNPSIRLTFDRMNLVFNLFDYLTDLFDMLLRKDQRQTIVHKNQLRISHCNLLDFYGRFLYHRGLNDCFLLFRFPHATRQHRRSKPMI